MQTKEDFMSDLIKKANTAKHIQFQFLKSWREYVTTRKIRRAHVLLVASLKQTADKLFKNYCKAIIDNETKVINLLAYSTTLEVLQFYEEELSILEDMLSEYEWYLYYGNWIDFILGMERPANKLWDHRG
jgi:hypothetical protein